MRVSTIQNNEIHAEEKRESSSGYAKIIFLTFAVATLIVAGFVFPLKDSLQQFLQWVEGLGAVAPVVVAFFYIISCLLFLPGSIITLGAGALFGVVLGTVVVSIGSVLGASAAFLTGRFFARDWIAKKVSGNPTFSTIDKAVGRQGFKIVFLTRLSPVFPFSLLNYAFGLTDVRFWPYFFASWIGMFPGTVMFVYFGSIAKTVASDVEKTSGQQVLFWVGLAATILVATVITRIARKALADATENGRDED